eukprot:96220_1
MAEKNSKDLTEVFVEFPTVDKDGKVTTKKISVAELIKEQVGQAKTATTVVKQKDKVDDQKKDDVSGNKLVIPDKEMRKKIIADLKKICEHSEPALNLDAMLLEDFKYVLDIFQENCHAVEYGYDEALINRVCYSYISSFTRKKFQSKDVTHKAQITGLRNGFKNRWVMQRWVKAHREMGWEDDKDVPKSVFKLDILMPLHCSKFLAFKPADDYQSCEIVCGEISKSAFAYLGAFLKHVNSKLDGTSGAAPVRTYSLAKDMSRDVKVNLKVLKSGNLDKQATSSLKKAFLCEFLPAFQKDPLGMGDSDSENEGNDGKVDGPKKKKQKLAASVDHLQV